MQQLAGQIGADERTLRRAASAGTVRCERPGPRRIRVDRSERAYLARHWALLTELRHALRTEPNVRLAVVYGSVARGDARADSDIDLLVEFADDHPTAAVALAVRLERAVGRELDIARLGRVEPRAPLLVLQALDEGRVVLDRDGRWPELMERHPAIAARARRANKVRRERAVEALATLADD